MNKKLKDLRVGVRLDIKKPPKIETPKSVYNRKVKHKKGLEDEKLRPFLFIFLSNINQLEDEKFRPFFYPVKLLLLYRSLHKC
jgi:hypothetical protein